MKKNKPKTKIYFIIGAISLIAIFALSYIINSERITGNAISLNSASGKSAESRVETEVSEALIEKVLRKLDADELHNPPFSSNTPKIEIKVDNAVYGAEVKKGIINVAEGTIEGEDISISLNKENAIKIANSASPEKIIRSGVENGDISFQIYSSKPVLFSKGYLTLYNRFN